MILSIIIPVYNVEKYIDGTLSSIYNQLANENLFEVIVVNDGTPDNSMIIVDKFAERHNNLIVINQENLGLSCARNAGLKKSKGTFVWFVDSDDLVTEQSLAEVFQIIKKYPDIDIYCFNHLEKSGNNLTPTCLFSKIVYQKYYGEIHDGFFYCRKLPTGLAQKNLFRKMFLEENELLFTPGIYHEDQDFIIRCYTKAKRILPLKNNWYIYNIRESGSITSTFKIKRFEDILLIIDKFRQLSIHSKDYKEITILEEGIFSLSFGLLSSTYKGNPEYQKFLSMEHKKIKSFLISSYFKSYRKNSLGKTYRLIKTLIH